MHKRATAHFPRHIFSSTKLQSWRVKARVYLLSNTFPGFEDHNDSVFIQHRRNVSNFVSLKNTHSTNLTSLMNFRVTLTRNFSVLAGAVGSSGTNETQTDRLAQLCRTNFVSPYSNSASVVTIQIWCLAICDQIGADNFSACVMWFDLSWVLCMLSDALAKIDPHLFWKHCASRNSDFSFKPL